MSFRTKSSAVVSGGNFQTSWHIYTDAECSKKASNVACESAVDHLTYYDKPIRAELKRPRPRILFKYSNNNVSDSPIFSEEIEGAPKYAVKLEK